MQQRTYTCYFEAIQMQGKFLPKILPEIDASIEKSTVYLSRSKYSVKTRDIQKLEFQEEDRSIRIADSKGRVFDLQNAKGGDKAWQQFCKRLHTLYERHRSESTKGFSSFLESSSKVGLGKHYHRKSTMVVSSTSASKPRRQRGTFGKQLTVNSSAGAATSRKVPRPIMPWDNEQEIVSDDTSDMDFRTTSPRPPIEEQSFSPVKSSLEAQNEQLEKDKAFFVAAATASTTSTSSAKRTRLKRKRSKSDRNESSDDDDNLFTSGGTFTTPATQNVVSPGGTTTTKKTTMASPERSSAFSPEKGQQTLSDFFSRPKPDRVLQKPVVKSSFDPATRYATSHQASALPGDTKTPDRLPVTPSKSPTLLVHSSSTKRQQLEQSDSWLRKSPSRVASVERRQRERLFGRQHQAFTPSKNDPIEEYENEHGNDKSLLEPPPLVKQDMRETNRQQFSNTKINYHRPGFRDPLPRHNRFLTPPYETNSALAPAQDDSFEPDPRRNRFRGLKNLGNTCYASASLQMICTMKDTVSALRARGGDLTSSVVAVAEQLRDSSTTTMPVDPVAVKQAMDAKTDKYQGFEQRDAHEFVSDLLDYMHEEVEEKEGNDGEKPMSPMDDLLMTVEVCLTCQSCGYDRTKLETYRHLSVDIIKKDGDEGGISRASVEMGLTHFFQPDIREIKCEKCEEGTHAMQTLRVLNRPKALLLHLKRFIFVEKRIEQPNTENESPNSPSAQNNFGTVEYVFQKNKEPVRLSEELTLAAFEAPDKNDDSTSATLKTRQYHLKSIVHHIGSRASSGHYTADVVRRLELDVAKAIDPEAKDAVDGWVAFDDGSSYVTSLEKILGSKNKQTTAYMLLYCLDESTSPHGN